MEHHRPRLEEMLRTHGPGSLHASHGRYALIGQPETLVILERMESAPFLLRGQWEKELETVFLDDLDSCGGRASVSAGEQPGNEQRGRQGDPFRPVGPCPTSGVHRPSLSVAPATLPPLISYFDRGA